MIVSLKFDLLCTFQLSKAARVEKVVGEFVSTANDELLVKGVPGGRKEGGSQIVEWKLEGDRLTFHIKSGAYVRAHTAVLRIRRSLATLLGDKYKVGIRKVDVDYFSAEFELEREVPKDVERKLSVLSKVLKARVDGNVVHLLFEPLPFQELRENVPDRVTKIAQEILVPPTPTRVVTERPRIVKRSPPKKLQFAEDPARAAIELGWVKEFPGRGQWIYTGPYAKLFYVIRDVLLTEVAHKLGFDPFLVPKLIPLKVMKRMPGYLDSIPEGMYYVSPPPREPKAFTKFKEELRMTKKIPAEELKNVLKSPFYVLAPAQCEPFWQFFAGETVDISDLPFKMYDCSGWTYRWEGGGVEGIVRLQEFQRVELTYIGTPKQVIDIRDSIVDRLVKVTDRTLDLEWRLVSARPFYAAKEEAVEGLAVAYDIEAYLPYRGPRDKSEWLETAGCFVHGKKFVDSFRIRERRGREIWTGCTGLGVSRFAAAFLAEYGFDQRRWPTAIRNKFKKMPKVPKLLLWPSGTHVKE